MPAANVTPGPDAHGAFRLGILSAVVIGLAALAFAYWFEVLAPVQIGYTLFVVFPVYLVFVASALSVWLGFGTDASDLRPVYREKKSP